MLFFYSIFSYLNGLVLEFCDCHNQLSSLKDYLFLLLIFMGLCSFKKKYYLFLVLPIILTLVASYFYLIAAVGRTMLFIAPFCYVLFLYKLDDFSKKIRILISILIMLSVIPIMRTTFNRYLHEDIHFNNYTKEFLYSIYKDSPKTLIYTVSCTRTNFSVDFYNKTEFNSQLNIKELKDINSKLILPCYVMKYDSFEVTSNTANMFKELKQRYKKNMHLKYRNEYTTVYLLYIDKE